MKTFKIVCSIFLALWTLALMAAALALAAHGALDYGQAIYHVLRIGAFGAWSYWLYESAQRSTPQKPPE